MNAGTLDRLRTHVLPGVRGARTLLYDLRQSLRDPEEWRLAKRLHLAACETERALVALLHDARAERNAKAKKTRGMG